ncbi:AsmA family protein [Rhodovulum adriaticum]|uniref:AsmA family protein n=1 Tax=Rhodovulum adriaticum TaxID=35804 RepID=UPI001A90F745|nr:AsmA-like C-terminal region-containing protein [Rhodovulum adriaticum]MBK1637311.1 hypothetical protein [Rhodovulum adriaticum]
MIWRITGARVTYIDHATGQRTDLSGLDATLALPDYAGAATLALSATLNGAPLSADVTIGQVAAMMEGRVSTVAVQAALAGAKAGFEGRAGLRPLAAEGTVQAEATDLPALFAALGQPAPDLPPGVGQRLGVSGQLTYAPEGSVHLREATLRQDDNVLSGAADLFLQEKPRLTGQFRAGALDLSAFTLEEPQANGAAGGDTARGWSTAPIDVGALGALDAELALTADSVNLGKGQLGPTQIRATLTDRRLVIDLQRVQGYGGTVTGAVVVNGRGGLSVRGDLAVAGMQMQPLLGDLAGFERLIGQGDVTLSVLGSGASLAAIMDSLDGTGAVSFGKGEILGLDITGMLRTLDTSYVGKGSKTIFDAITASFTIEDGVLRNDDLSFVAPLLRAVGEGRVGLGGQTVKYRLVPTALSGTDGKGGLKVPLLIRGSWSDPKFQLDLEALAEEELDLEGQREALKEQAEAVAEKAREDLRTRAAEELGVSSDEGESLEDAARRKLREEAEKGLRGLFGIK